MKLSKLFRFIDRITPTIYDPNPNEMPSLLNIIPTNITKKSSNNDIVKLYAYRSINTPDELERFNLDGMYFNDEIEQTLNECIVKSIPLNVECVRYRNFNNILSKMYNTWKVIKVQKHENSDEWIQLDQHSKIFYK